MTATERPLFWKGAKKKIFGRANQYYKLFRAHWELSAGRITRLLVAMGVRFTTLNAELGAAVALLLSGGGKASTTG